MEHDSKVKLTLFEKACLEILELSDIELNDLENIFWDKADLLNLTKDSWFDFARDSMPKEIYDRLFSCLYIGWLMHKIYTEQNEQ